MKRYQILIIILTTVAGISCNHNSKIDEKFIKIDDKLINSIIKIHYELPNMEWSSDFKKFYNEVVSQQLRFSSSETLNKILSECISACHLIPYEKSFEILETLDIYDHFLQQNIVAKHRAQKICIPGPRGPMGPAGPAGSFSATYGQLLVSSQEISIISHDSWVAIPFNSVGASSGMTVSTTSPATITVLKAGTYQINFSLYFLVDDSHEAPFAQTTYSIGTKLNSGTTTPVAAVYCSELGNLSLNYSDILELSANDQIQFYMSSSSATSNDNFVLLENGNAYLMQISN